MNIKQNKYEKPPSEIEAGLLKKFFAAPIWSRGDEFFVEKRNGGVSIRANGGGTTSVEATDLDAADATLVLTLLGMEFGRHRRVADELIIDLRDSTVVPVHVRDRWRVFTMPLQQGVAAGFRRFAASRVYALDEIGFLPEQNEQIRNALTSGARGGGLIFVGGGTGSGKSNTLNALGVELEKRTGVSVYEIGDPIKFPNGGRMQVSAAASRRYEDQPAMSLIQGATMMKPDVLIHHQVRKDDDVKELVAAALNGVLVLAGIHAATAENVLERLLFYSNADFLAQTVKMVIAQKLVGVEKIPEYLQSIRRVETQFNRIAVAEVLTINQHLKSHLRRTGHPGKLANLAHDKDGFLTYSEAAQSHRDRGAVFEARDAAAAFDGKN